MVCWITEFARLLLLFWFDNEDSEIGMVIASERVWWSEVKMVEKMVKRRSGV